MGDEIIATESNLDRSRLFLVKITQFTVADMIAVNKLLERKKRPGHENNKKIPCRYDAEITCFPQYCYWRIKESIELELYIYFINARTVGSLEGKFSPLFGNRASCFGIGKDYSVFMQTNKTTINNYFTSYNDDRWPTANDSIIMQPHTILSTPVSNQIIPSTINVDKGKSAIDPIEILTYESSEVSDDEQESRSEELEVHPPFLQGMRPHSGVRSNLPPIHDNRADPNIPKPPRIRYLKEIMSYVVLRRQNPQGGDFRGIDLDEREQMEVRDVHPRIKQFLGGGKSQNVFHGQIDILTDTVLCEVKRWSEWRKALSQIDDYSDSYPFHKKWVHFFGPRIPDDLMIRVFVKLVEKDIIVTYDALPL